MSIPTMYPTVNATGLADNFTYVGATTNSLGGPVILLTTWLIAFYALQGFPRDAKIQASTLLTLVLSLLFQAISLSTPQVTGILLAILIISVVADRLTRPQYG